MSTIANHLDWDRRQHERTRKLLEEKSRRYYSTSIDAPIPKITIFITLAPFLFTSTIWLHWKIENWIYCHKNATLSNIPRFPMTENFDTDMALVRNVSEIMNFTKLLEGYILRFKNMSMEGGEKLENGTNVMVNGTIGRNITDYTNFMKLNMEKVYKNYEIWRPITSLLYFPALQDFWYLRPRITDQHLLVIVLGFDYQPSALTSSIKGVLGARENMFLYWLGLLLVVLICSYYLEMEVLHGIKRFYLKMLATTWILTMALCSYFNIGFILEPIAYSLAAICVFNNHKKFTFYYVVWLAIRLGFVLKKYLQDVDIKAIDFDAMLNDQDLKVVVTSILWSFVMGVIYRRAQEKTIHHIRYSVGGYVKSR